MICEKICVSDRRLLSTLEAATAGEATGVDGSTSGSGVALGVGLFFLGGLSASSSTAYDLCSLGDVACVVWRKSSSRAIVRVP